MIYHVLKDGTVVPDVKGHVIKADQFPLLYQVISNIQERSDQKKNEVI